jgi:helix-turn-helix protein
MLRPTLSRVIYLIVWRAKREHGFSLDGIYDWLCHREGGSPAITARGGRQSTTKPQPPGSVSGARGWLDGYNGPYPSLGRRFHSHQLLPFSGPFSCSQVREDGPGRAHSPGPRCRVPLVEEETYTPPEAARILKLSRRRVTQMLAAGELEGTQDDPETGRWAIPQRAVHERLKDRPARGRADDNRPRPSEAPQEAAELIEARRPWWSKLFGGRSR